MGVVRVPVLSTVIFMRCVRHCCRTGAGPLGGGRGEGHMWVLVPLPMTAATRDQAGRAQFRVHALGRHPPAAVRRPSRQLGLELGVPAGSLTVLCCSSMRVLCLPCGGLGVHRHRVLGPTHHHHGVANLKGSRLTDGHGGGFVD